MNKKFTLLKRAIVFSVALSSALLSCSQSFSQGSWTQIASVPGPGRNQPVAFTIGTKGYLGTGYNGGTYYNDFWEYDPSTNTWAQKANFMGSARYGATAIVIGSKGYVTGGYDGGPYTTGFFEYDPSSNTWAQKANFAGQARMNSAGFSIGTKGYIGTGAGSSYNYDLWEYDQGSDTWTAKANYPGGGRYGATGFSIGTKGYIAVGTDGGGNFFQDLYEWDQGSNTWTQKSSMTGPGRHYQPSFVINNKAYVPTGTGSGGAYQDVWEWDQSNDTWTQVANFAGGSRSGATAFSIGGKGYVGTGSGSDMWEFDPCGGYVPTITPDGPTTFCQGGSVNLSASTGNTYSWSDASTLAFNSVTTSGTYTVTVTNANGCTGTSAPTVVTVNNSPATPTVTNDGPVCSGSSLNLTAGFVAGATYSWTGPNGFTSSLQNPNISNVSAAEAGSYSVIASANGCASGTATTTVIINSTPTTTTSFTNVSCNGGSDGSVNVTPSGGAGPYTYSWSPSGGSSASATGLSAGNYTVTITDANGCTNTANETITEPTAITTSFSITSVTCNGGVDGAAAVTTSGGSPVYAYLWSPGGSTAAIASGLPAGTYTVTITDANGCTLSSNATITEPAGLMINAGADQSICDGGTATLNGSASGGSSPYVFNWSPAGDLTNPAILNPVASPLTSTTYTLSVTDNNGCIASDAITVMVNALPAANAGADQAVCEGSTINFTGTGGLTYVWSGPAGYTSSLQNPSINNALINNSGTYTLSVTDANGCDNSDAVIVTVNSMPSVTATSNSPVCENDLLNLNGSGGVSYSWTGPNGFTSTVSSPSLTASINTGGTYSLTVADVNGCSNSTSVSIVVNAIPLADAGADQGLCTSETLNLNATGGVSYSWTGPNGFMSSLPNPSLNNVTVINDGLYIVSVSNAAGCSNSDSVVVGVTPNPIINGTINFLGAPVNSGSVSAYLLDGSGAFSFTGSTAVDGSGNYSFTALNVGSYFIKAELDTSLYPGAVATYASNYFAWSDADTLVALCGGNFTSDINVIQAPQLTGTGVISGQIFGGNGPMKTWQQGDPVPGVDVTLEQNPGSVMLAQTTTDNAGAYTFVNVPTGSFTIYVDVPGLDMSASYDVTISATNNTFDQASFYVDSTGTIDTVRNVISGMKQTVIKSGSINAYPNPYATYTSIEYTLIERSTVNIEVYNMLGEKITTLVNTSKDAGKYTEKFSAKAIGLGAGVYFVKTNINGKIQTIRLIEIN